ncbi:hypothetical protein H6P81_012658 [Aristolochia fimbriata]|uniref:Uncharacterized protein n=1 Tax=Aristolochia fimbriata TaxID=158543 RepID=A0AAV7EEK5_ARIFI|nr:hypothetical protein H6P81_012658 [Aristolochia fimbriata]
MTSTVTGPSIPSTAMGTLLGPPEIRSSGGGKPAAESGDPFLDAMAAGFNTAASSTGSPQMGFTENCSPTFFTSGNPCLDFFYHIVPSTPPETLVNWLRDAWDYDALTTLKLVCHLRGVRGTGKSDKNGFYAAALWLHQFHPKTLSINLKHISRFGYLKDLPVILFQLLEGRHVRRSHRREGTWGRSKRGRRRGVPDRRVKQRGSKLDAMLKPGDSALVARDLRHKKTAELATRAIERYNRDPDYKFLHDQVSDCFAELLAADLQTLKTGEPCGIGLAAKWCPSLDSSFDRSTLLCESIARRMFPRDSNPEYTDLEERYYAYRVRDRLRKEVLVPLRKALELPEVYMSARLWAALPYERVASVAMKNYKEHFEKHDSNRFKEFLNRVKEGTAKIAAGALLPHEILADADDTVADLQWKRMISDLSEKGKLTNCLAVCDVSGSMNGIPMEVCIGMGILVSDLSEEPWKGKVITFSRDPQIHSIEGDTLKEKVQFVREMDWGQNTDFQKVFDRILDVAVTAKLDEQKMIKRLFVFSDMEFDAASSNPWETDYQVIKKKFTKRGYSVPEMVFWNLRDSRAMPVPGDAKGVALVSGFSKNLLKIFLEGDGVMNPVAVMEAALKGKEYDDLVVLD